MLKQGVRLGMTVTNWIVFSYKRWKFKLPLHKYDFCHLAAETHARKKCLVSRFQQTVIMHTGEMLQFCNCSASSRVVFQGCLLALGLLQPAFVCHHLVAPTRASTGLRPNQFFAGNADHLLVAFFCLYVLVIDAAP